MLLLDRFIGEDGKRYLLEALAAQTLVQGDLAVAAELGEAAEVLGCRPGDILMRQHESDNDIYLILAGNFSIIVNGHEVARRGPRHSVGEMAIVDPTATRSATVIAQDDSVVARIPERVFSDVASRHSVLWRRIATELAGRIRDWNELIRRKNDVPRVFVGSSTESLEIANAIQAGLGRDPFIVTVWTNEVFGPSGFAIEALERQAKEIDFAVLVLGPDDRVTSRADEAWAPRDNTILELGLFIGALGRMRVFVVMPRSLEVKLPTDLLGVAPLRYHAQEIPGAVQIGPVCTQLRQAFSDMGPR
jgi:CRP/FNR family transcriptional regulator, cyclic AMP receptor protein